MQWPYAECPLHTRTHRKAEGTLALKGAHAHGAKWDESISCTCMRSATDAGNYPGQQGRACSRIWTRERRVDSVATLMSCRMTPRTTKLISPYDAMATPAGHLQRHGKETSRNGCCKIETSIVCRTPRAGPHLLSPPPAAPTRQCQQCGQQRFSTPLQSLYVHACFPAQTPPVLPCSNCAALLAWMC